MHAIVADAKGRVFRTEFEDDVRLSVGVRHETPLVEINGDPTVVALNDADRMLRHRGSVRASESIFPPEHRKGRNSFRARLLWTAGFGAEGVIVSVVV